MIAIIIIITLISLFIIAELFRRSLKFALFSFGILPFLLAPLWPKNLGGFSFTWLKSYSVTIAVLFILSLRFTKIGKNLSYLKILLYILAINIFEVVFTTSYFSIGLSDYIIAIIGVVLIIAIPWFKNSLRVDLTSKYKDLHVELSYAWVAVYTLWDFVFIYNHFRQNSLIHIAVLGAPVLSSLIKKELYIQARAFTLAFYLIMMNTFGYEIVENPPNMFNSTLSLVMSLICLSMLIICMLYKFLKKEGELL